MQELSLAEARGLKEFFDVRRVHLPPNVNAAIGCVGITLVQQNPPMYGILLNLHEAVDPESLVAVVGQELAENIVTKVIGQSHEFGSVNPH